MNLRTNILQSIQNIIGAKLRSFLAALGIVVGTSSVVALISSSQLATENALSQFKSLGTNLITMSISPKRGRSNNSSKIIPISIKDIQYMKNISPNIIFAAPYTSSYSSIYYNGKSISGQIIGADINLFHILKLKIDKGRFIRLIDGDNLFAVVGSRIKKQMKKIKLSNILSKQIQSNRTYFTTIGSLAPIKPNLFIYINANNSIFIPIKTSFNMNPRTKISNVVFRTKKGINPDQIQNKLRDKLNVKLPDYQFRFNNPKQILDIVSKQKKSFTWLLGMVGLISLIVGGIGVMNIMLVSIVERRQEIGIRLAIGATQKDIMLMFLIESITLTFLGGLFGILTGIAITYTIADLSGWGFSLYYLPIILGFTVSVGSGLISGLYPAYRAAQLDPILILSGN